MPTNTPLPTVSTGGVIAAATTNDTAVLNTCIGLFGASAPLVGGTLPPLNAPNFQIQAGRALVSPSSGNFTFTFPSAFPNGLLCLFLQGEGSQSNADSIDIYSGSTKTTGAGIWWVNGIGYTATNVVVHYMAIGF